MVKICCGAPPSSAVLASRCSSAGERVCAFWRRRVWKKWS